VTRKGFLGPGFYAAFTTSGLVTDEQKEMEEEEEVFRGKYGQEPPVTMRLRAATSTCMQFEGATSRDLARQAHQYGLSLALLHQGARLLHRLPSFLYVRLAACVRGGGVSGPAYSPPGRVLTRAYY
jgi:hypothetical protein